LALTFKIVFLCPKQWVRKTLVMTLVMTTPQKLVVCLLLQ
jgi:hypothetical protein